MKRRKGLLDEEKFLPPLPEQLPRGVSSLPGYGQTSPVAQGLLGFTGRNPTYSVMDPQAQEMSDAYRLGEQASVASQLYGSVLPFAAASTMANAARVPGASMAIMDVSGLPNQGRDAIRKMADDLSSVLKERGFNVDLRHSGSSAGPSSYLKIYDPETGRFFTKDIRISGHSKGPFEASGVIDIGNPQEFQQILDAANQMRSMGVSQSMQKQKIISEIVQRKIEEGIKPKKAYQEAYKETEEMFPRSGLLDE